MAYCVFSFARDVGREASAKNPSTDVLLASNWQTSKRWERWSIPLFTSLAQTLWCNRFWRYTCVISAEVNTLCNQITGKRKSTDPYLRQIPSSEMHFCTVSFPCLICMGLYEIYSHALLTKREVEMAGYWWLLWAAFLWTEMKSRSIKTLKKNEINIQPSWPNKLGQDRTCIEHSILIFLHSISLSFLLAARGEN